jgi:hypothetical protein
VDAHELTRVLAMIKSGDQMRTNLRHSSQPNTRGVGVENSRLPQEVHKAWLTLNCAIHVPAEFTCRGLKISLHAVFMRISAEFTCGIFAVRSLDIRKCGKYGGFCVLFGGVWSLCIVLSRCPHLDIFYFRLQIHIQEGNRSQKS